MSHFDGLDNEVNEGMSGKNSGVPMGFARLNAHVGIRKATYYLIGGYTGSGKTSLIDDAFVLNPLDYVIRKNSELDLHILYFSMERRKNFKLAKWISRRIFLDTAVMLPVAKILGWVSKENRLNSEEYALFQQYRDYIDCLMEKIEIIDGPQNPTGVRKYVEQVYAPKVGLLDSTDVYNKKFNHFRDDLITLIISDHIGLNTLEKNLPSKKAVIDKGSEDKQRWRDLYGFSVVDVSQFNRDIANPLRIKNGDVEPMLEDFKDSGNTQENADVVLSLFDPYRYKVPDPSGYDLEKLRGDNGEKKYRNLRILKNSFGTDDIRIGLAFQPEVGMFKEMPKLKDMTDQIYKSIIDNSYFLK